MAKALVFGAIHGIQIFQRLCDTIVHILSKHKVKVWNYIDDMVPGVEKEQADYIFNEPVIVVEEVGYLTSRVLFSQFIKKKSKIEVFEMNNVKIALEIWNQQWEICFYLILLHGLKFQW